MAAIIKPKRSSTPSAAPTTGDIVEGEIAINLVDKKIYSRETNTIIELGANYTITAGTGLTGTGTVESEPTLALDATSALNTDHSAVSVVAGAGMTGGGTIESSRTLNVIAGTGITVNANDVQIDETYTGALYLAKTSDVDIVSGTTDTLAAGNKGQDIVYTSGSSVAVTLPDGLAVGFQCTLTQAGAGTVTVTCSGADTVNGASSVAISARYSGISLIKYDTGLWVAVGNIA